MKRLANFYLSCCGWLLLVAGVAYSSMAQAAKTVRVGVLALEGPAHASAFWHWAGVSLRKALPNETFEFQYFDLSDLRKAVSGNAVDFVITNSGNYVELESAFANSGDIILNSSSWDLAAVSSARGWSSLQALRERAPT